LAIGVLISVFYLPESPATLSAIFMQIDGKRGGIRTAVTHSPLALAVTGIKNGAIEG
jgi:hypothetical protein